MATTDDVESSVKIGWRSRPWASLLVFVLALPVGFAVFVVAVQLSFGGSGGHVEQGSRSILAETLALLFMALAGLMPTYGVWLARRSLQQGTSGVGWLGLGLNAVALACLAVVIVINALQLLHVISAHAQ